MRDFFEIVIVALLVICAFTPFVIAFDKARRDMDADDEGDEQ